MKLGSVELLLLLVVLSRRRRATPPTQQGTGEWEPQPDPDGFNVPVIPLPANPLKVP